MTVYVVPVIFLTVLILSFLKKKDPYSYYIEGARSAMDLMFQVLPYLLTIMMACEVFRSSGVAALLANLMEPVMKFVGIPKELTELIILRPLSGAGSLSILDNIYSTYGTDTYIGRCASLIYGSSETVFYISSIYFSQSKVKKLGYAIPVALVSTIMGCIIGCALLRIM